MTYPGTGFNNSQTIDCRIGLSRNKAEVNFLLTNSGICGAIEEPTRAVMLQNPRRECRMGVGNISTVYT